MRFPIWRFDSLTLRVGLRVRCSVLVLVFVLSAATASLAVPGPGKRWARLDSPHFTLFSSATERATRGLARDLEDLRAALQTLLPDAELRSPVPTWIYVFEHRIDFAPYRPLYQGRREEVDGYFLAHAHGNYVAIDGDARSDPRRTILHEFLHEVERRNLPGLPLWLAEGLAEVYSSFEARGSKVVVGLPHRNHSILFRRQPLMPLAELLAIGHGDRDYHRGAQRDMFYAQSWALSHMLAMNGEYDDALQAYLQALAAGEDANDAFVRVIGDLDTIEAALRSYIRGRYPVRTLPREAALGGQGLDTQPASTLEKMAYPEVLFRLGDLLAHGAVGHLDFAASHFEAALDAQPNHAPAIAGLGFLAERAGDAEKALGFYHRASRAAPHDARLAYLYGQGLLRSVGLATLATRAASPAQYESILAARRALTDATSLAPDFGEAWVELGFTYAAEEVPPVEAVTVLERAHQLLPERVDVTYNLFLVLARLGERGRAEKLLVTAIEPFAEARVVAQASRTLLNLDIAQANTLLAGQRLDELEPVLERIVSAAERCSQEPAVQDSGIRQPCTPEQRALGNSAVVVRAREQLEHLRAAGVAPARVQGADTRYRQAMRHAAAGEYATAETVLEQLVALLEDGAERDEALELLAVVRSQR